MRPVRQRTQRAINRPFLPRKLLLEREVPLNPAWLARCPPCSMALSPFRFRLPGRFPTLILPRPGLLLAALQIGAQRRGEPPLARFLLGTPGRRQMRRFARHRDVIGAWTIVCRAFWQFFPPCECGGHSGSTPSVASGSLDRAGLLVNRRALVYVRRRLRDSCGAAVAQW